MIICIIFICRKIIILFVIAIIILDCCALIRSILLFRDGLLLTPCWYPYDNSQTKFLAISWVHIEICSISGAVVAACCDTIFAGFLIKVCCQLEILKLRFHHLTLIQKECQMDENCLNLEEKKHLSICINHHKHILRCTKDISHIFYPILLGQFFLGIMLICCAVYRISATKSNVEFVLLVVYLSVIFTEIFFYCWFGNEVMVASLDLMNAIFTMDWKTLPLGRQKELLFILLRAKTPIKITSSFLVTLSNDSFVTILKASYSMFNLIRTTNT
ncbi:odorant receptor 10-like [Prorops nasuta]|uniref:odorant receptor 10-like n=1 Tax=Prorops nasuta TaxID=863751 RepID=UPI0034CE6DE4